MAAMHVHSIQVWSYQRLIQFQYNLTVCVYKCFIYHTVTCRKIAKARLLLFCT